METFFSDDALKIYSPAQDMILLTARNTIISFPRRTSTYEIRFSRGALRSLSRKREHDESRTKSLNWPRFNEFGRSIERTSFALLTFRPCRTGINIFANMYVSPTIYGPRFSSPPLSLSLSSLWYPHPLAIVEPSKSRTNNQVDAERKLPFLSLSSSFSRRLSISVPAYSIGICKSPRSSRSRAYRVPTCVTHVRTVHVCVHVIAYVHG